ncbi:HEL337Wp [Eremothecium sinecaudum]|uniref:HEL337Wp n=1 Tax=Eremothecium sinecaudum TaxID=45286 RepID=A0A0X8HT33_9SACH|nr:HEL337Wp [Eremothecium sinecaudum]AMD20944.1 HEL337Wp [Eremothecium sinecaudum]
MVFEKLVSFRLDYAPQYKLTKYISNHSRLQIIHLHSKSSPIVEGYFAVGTECNNDSGVAHTLEHLIFMGSKKYPYKGLLDTVGGIAMSNTNAWTATDQTVYTLESVGWPGFKKLLPVYLDHLCNPTLTDYAYTTEVHHIDPKECTDKGVVYSEMEAIEASSGFITNLEKQRLMFPEGNAYRYETGGLTQNLRKLTNNEIREFYAKMYSPENMYLIICGNVPADELLEVMEQFDAELPKFDKKRVRPFIDSPNSQIPEKRTEIVESIVEFPELDESRGEVAMAWIGKDYLDTVNDLAVSMLFEYLTDTSLAPFNKELVEMENPLATDVSYWPDCYMKTIMNLTLHGVPSSKLEEARDKVLGILSNHKIDIKRMRQVIDKNKWVQVRSTERNGSSFLSEICIMDFLYGDENGNSLKRSMDLTDFDILLDWKTEDWQSLLAEVLVENKPVIVLGKPSANKYNELEEDQKNLINHRKRTFSDEKLGQLQATIDEAQRQNNKPIPEELMNGFIIKDPASSVDFIKTKNITTVEHEYNDLEDELTLKVLANRPKDFPLFIHLEHFPSQFVTVQLLLNSRVVKDTSLLPYFYIFRQLFTLPMKDENNNIIDYEEIVKQLENECIVNEISLGFSAEFTDLISLEIECKSSDYANAVKWIKHCLYDMVFDQNRVSILLEKFLNSIVETKREGVQMKQSLFNRHMFTDRSMKKSTDFIFVQKVLDGVLQHITEGNYETEVLPKLESFRDQLRSHFHKFHILIFGDIEKLDDVYQPWKQLVDKLPMDKSQVVVPPTPRLLETVSNLGLDPKSTAYIATTPASASTYMSCVTSVPINLDYQHPDYPAVCMAAAYLEVCEGPFWKGIRGSGLAYGANVGKQFEFNCLSYSIYRGVDVISCYESGKRIIEDLANGITVFEEKLVHCALASIIHGLAGAESNYFNAATIKYSNNFCKKRGPDFNSRFLAKVGSVTIQDLKTVMQKYFINMFNSEKGAVFITCHPSKLESVQEFLESQGYEVIVEEFEATDSASEYSSDYDSN